MWKKFGNENVTIDQEFGTGECIFCCNGLFGQLSCWHEKYEKLSGMVWKATARDWNKSFTNIEHRTQGAVGWEGLVSILTFPHQVGSSPRSYPFTSATVRTPVYIATTSGRNLSDMWWSTFDISEHSRPQSLLGTGARGPGGSGDTGFEVQDFRTSGHFRIRSKLGDPLLKALNHINLQSLILGQE